MNDTYPLQLSLLCAEQCLGVAKRLHKGGDLGILLLQACAAACSMHVLSGSCVRLATDSRSCWHALHAHWHCWHAHSIGI